MLTLSNILVSYDGSRISQERIGYGFDGTLPDIGGLKGGMAYDLYNGKFANIFASVDAYVSRRVTLSLDYDYYVPTFDGDSIWNFFMAMPQNDLGARVAWDATDHLDFAAGARARAFLLQSEAEKVDAPTSPNGLSNGNYYPSSGLELMGVTAPESM